MSKRIASVALLALAPILLLAACGKKERAGVFAGRNAPDEFIVGRAAPLAVPPDFALVPPRPGQPRPQDADSSTQALNALFGGQRRPSQGEQILLQQAGATAPAPGIRSDTGAATPQTVDKGAATRDIIDAPASASPQATATTGGAQAGGSAQPGGATAPSTGASPPPQ